MTDEIVDGLPLAAPTGDETLVGQVPGGAPVRLAVRGVAALAAGRTAAEVTAEARRLDAAQQAGFFGSAENHTVPAVTFDLSDADGQTEVVAARRPVTLSAAQTTALEGGAAASLDVRYPVASGQ